MTQKTGQMQTLEPLAIRKDEGEARWWFGALAEIKATAADTGGQMTIVEARTRRRRGAAPRPSP